MHTNCDAQQMLDHQINRERGIQFGRHEQQEDGYSMIAGLYRSALQESLGLQDERDETFSMFDARANFSCKLAKKLQENALGRTGESEKAANALGLSELAASKERSSDDKERWRKICDTLFSITLYELLRHIIKPMTGDVIAKDDDNKSKEDENGDDTDYPWVALLQVYQSVWDAYLLEITLQANGAWGKAKILQRNDIPQQSRAHIRQAMLHKALADTGINAKQGLAFAGDLIALVMDESVLPKRLFELGIRKKDIQFQKSKHKGKAEVDTWCLKPTDELLQRIHGRMESSRLIYQYAPLLIPPRNWDSQDGGVHSGAYYASPLPFYKFPIKNDRIDAFIEICNGLDNREVFTAVNALQNTSWRINAKVWDAVQKLLQMAEGHQSGTNEIIECINAILYDKSLEQDIKHLTPDQRKKKENLPGFRLLKGISRNVLDDLCGQKEFYFAYQADARGRLYPKTGQFGPQGEDLSKALLEFSQAKPLTLDGVSALAQHGSQQIRSTRILHYLGITDRTIPTFEERRQWIDAHAQQILQVARAPTDEVWWMDSSLTKKPFSFLAFCFAWADYLEHGEDVMCSLPVHVDGTCNGLQHIAALTGDSKLAQATNVLPGDPQDIYQQTADAVRQALYAVGEPIQHTAEEMRQSTPDHENNLKEEIDRNCLASCRDFIDRDVAKEIVMIIPYGAGEKSYKKKLREKLFNRYITRENEVFSCSLENWAESLNCKVFCLLETSATTIASTFTKVLESNYPSIKTFKTLLKHTISPLIKRNIPLLWVTPSDFCALQRYFQQDISVEVVSALFGNKKLRLSYPRLKDDIDQNKQKTSILANLIHSFDASHLVKTVCLAQQKGILSFSVIHDSYGTHPADMKVLAWSLRQAFVDMYTATPQPMTHFQLWCEAVVYVHDHALTKDDYGGYEPTSSEKLLLEQVRQWSIQESGKESSGETSKTNFTKKRINKKTELEKDKPSDVDLFQVMDSRYFFS